MARIRTENCDARIIGSAERRRLVPYSDVHIWRLEQAGLFPQRIKLGERRIGWDLNEVLEWIDLRKSRRQS
ncbi:helix-turn-helix transcriptional regulator [Bradyrhizobium sp. SEMIA]|uniref:helix-turn-helix transcriptional regulator n=1 Tax=Bradyrhizobium sp. SEMIA TaxID=2597515 RepID=UPI0018A38942|nr:AlpA family phage regulatory protein [Bradyrhizobium sp. SEMIA]QOG20581.1 AlpA family phage regulatory protein [Bradyrhizobium sp. SEMIA]